jgi:biopolymer transport protein ExbD
MFGKFEHNKSPAPMSEINMVPLIDVMLVLLVIFIITAPLFTHAVKLNLPQASATPNEQQPDKIEFAVNVNGQYFWNGEAVTRAIAQTRFAYEAKRSPQPELHIRADQNVPYKFVATAMADASTAGLSRIGFISEPEK